MTLEERIIALEREVLDTQLAAANLIANFLRGLVTSEEGRAVVVLALAKAAQSADPSTARLARLVARAVARRIH